METVGRWWNGRWGRIARRDVWLKREGHGVGEVWYVEARQGDGDARVWTSNPLPERRARQLALDMLKRGSDEWRDLTDVSRKGPAPPA